jgi:macrodomain Ter protein organizer (MatP/YcbG family)
MEEDWVLDPRKFPRRIELELSRELIERLEVLSRRSGLSVSELIVQMLAQAAADSQELND